MFIAQAKRTRRGFTLLEIMLAVAILSMMSLAIYRFVQSNVTALRISSETNAIDAQYAGFVRLLSSEWTTLPGGNGALVGEPLKLNGRPRDEITWICSAGPGLLTRYAAGEYRVSLRLQPAAKGSDRLELGLLRKPYDVTQLTDGAETWVPLLGGVESLQIRYFDPRLNVWVDKWTDTITLPRLVKLDIGQPGNPTPWEAIIALARTPL
ncbi:MAG TPA: prepilin-type N-terminal cleavage/methylation domain-containing protein [Chthoniobacterales bacterium]|nr:prepilin-type N-terminal cleavage/methylation domain-containing protein [Chthoniobacterales bacterium]